MSLLFTLLRFFIAGGRNRVTGSKSFAKVRAKLAINPNLISS